MVHTGRGIPPWYPQEEGYPPGCMRESVPTWVHEREYTPWYTQGEVHLPWYTQGEVHPPWYTPERHPGGYMPPCYTPGRHPGGYNALFTHPRGTLVGMLLLFLTRETPWWVLFLFSPPERHSGGYYSPFPHPRGTLVGITSLFLTLGDTLVGINLSFSLPGILS